MSSKVEMDLKNAKTCPECKKKGITHLVTPEGSVGNDSCWVDWEAFVFGIYLVSTDDYNKAMSTRH